ncbi:aldehyde dehydrogenase family protein [Yinghuangia sp. YIM S09857]|uniref:aldehyde dehydrogenase family protein n=1 Tax=Yinghuangia sp. YIM S09857 TaxID=3436929 RepID=UPI003F539E50
MNDTVLWSESRMLVDGELVTAPDGRTFENVNPATGRTIGVTADADAGLMGSAIAAARTAFDTTEWSSDLGLRMRCLRQLLAGLEKHREELRALTVAEVGVPVSLTTGPHLDAALALVPWTLDLAERYEWESDRGQVKGQQGTTHRYIRREPVGVVGAITPWNAPMQINLAKLIPALASGNTAVLKPAPDTPWTATALGRIAAEETDLPPGVLNVVTTSDNAVAQQLADDARVDMISFTGSTATGRHLMARAAQTVKKTFLELGGKSASVVFDDADPATVIRGAMAIIWHAGQGCAINSRLLVQRGLYDIVVGGLAQALPAVPYGDPTDPKTVMGPLVSSIQRERVLGMIERGIADGARLVTGGGAPAHLSEGWFVEPTLLADVDPDSELAQQEVFGPVLSVIPFDDEEHAVTIANNSIYGLAGQVTSADAERATRVAGRIRAGSVNVNGGQYFAPDMPFGGYRQSGIGREMGAAGFEEYLETKVLAIGV